MLKEAFFSVDVNDSVVLVRKKGVWTIVSDIAYVTELAEAFSKFKSKNFVVIVDMRGWICPTEVSTSKFKANIVLDRRAQTGECWIIDDPRDSDHLLRHVAIPSLDFLRSEDLSKVNEWLLRQALPPHLLEEVKTWLVTEPNS